MEKTVKEQKQKIKKPAKTIDNSKFLPGITPELLHGKYYLIGAGWWTISNTFGRAKGRTECPFCGNTQTFYIWSYCGGGKKCDNCGVILGGRGGWADPLKFRSENQFLNNSQ